MDVRDDTPIYFVETGDELPAQDTESYRYAMGKFLEWIESRGVTSPEEVNARHVREYVAQLVAADKKQHRLGSCAGSKNTSPHCAGARIGTDARLCLV